MRVLTVLIASDGGVVDVAALWVGAVVALPLLFMFNVETDSDRAAPRSLAARRWALLIIAVAAAGIICLLVLPAGNAEWGFAAAWRDSVTLLGLGLLSMTVLPSAAIWVVPLVVAIASMLFSWPAYPGLSVSLWGALRAPNGLTLQPGVPNLSIPLCLGIAAAGIVTYASGVKWRPAALISDVTARHPAASKQRFRGFKSGLRRVSLEMPLSLIIAGIVVWSLLTDLSSWGGSPRLLLAENVTAAVIFYVPCAVLLGVIVGQARWRSSTAVWQVLSERASWTLLGRACIGSAATAVAAVGTPVLILAVIASGDLGRYVGVTVVVREFLAGWVSVLVVLGEVTLGAALGAFLGWWTKAVWLPPLCLVVAFAVMVPAPLPPSQDADQQWAARYGYATCATIGHHGAKVCTTTPNTGYLPAAAATLTQVYDQSAHPQALPGIVLLTNAGTMGGNIHPEGLEHPPDIGTSSSRGLTPPDRLNTSDSLSSTDPRESLSYSTNAWCRGTNLYDLQNLFGVSQYQQTSTMNRTLAALEHCRVEK